jgi:hypothetical protein
MQIHALTYFFVCKCMYLHVRAYICMYCMYLPDLTAPASFDRSRPPSRPPVRYTLHTKYIQNVCNSMYLHVFHVFACIVCICVYCMYLYVLYVLYVFVCIVCMCMYWYVLHVFACIVCICMYCMYLYVLYVFVCTVCIVCICVYYYLTPGLLIRSKSSLT